MVEASGDSEAADVFDFVDEFLTDRERGRERPLAEYLARYPRCQEAVAREFLALRAPTADEPRSKVGTSDAPGASGATNAGPDAQGPRIGPYRILSEIGRGGQGTVFLAEDTRIARRVALKVLASRLDLVTAERRARFRREAEVIARLEHPAICGVYDADVDGETPYIAMRFVEGRTLAQILAEARSAPAADPNAQTAVVWPPSSPPAVRRVLSLFERLARALHAAHEAGIVHRDVKPGNVMVAPDGLPMLLDFGLARDEQSELATLTQSGEMFGTPAYMSPEQLSGSAARIDRRTDVYSLGVALFEALTLERPFDAPSRLELQRRIQLEPPPDPRKRNPALGEDVKVVLETALEKDPARRYATALELAEDLRRIREYEPIRARPAGWPLRLLRWRQRHPVLAVSISGTIVFLAAGLLLTLSLLDKKDQALESALARHLAERCVALIPEDPALALALGIEAADREIRLAHDGRGANVLTRSALFQALDACRLERVLSGEPAHIVTDVAISPDGRAIAIATDTGDARVFDLETGRRLLDLPRHPGLVAKIAWSPDGARLATAASDGKARLHDARTGALVHEIDIGDPLSRIECSPDGSRLLAVTTTGRAKAYDARSFEPVFELEQGVGGIAWAAFAPPDGSRILTRAAPAHARASSIAVWDARDGSRLFDLETHAGPVVDCAIDEARGRVAVATRTGAVRVYDLATREASGAPLALDAPAGFVAFSPDGGRLLAASDLGEEGGACVFDLASGARIELSGHGGRRIVHGAFSPDGARVATASIDTTTRVWNARTGAAELVLGARDRPAGVCWRPDGRRLVTWNKGPSVQVWYARGRPDLVDLVGHAARASAACFSPDGALALTASDDGTARIWSVRPASSATKDEEPGALLHVLRHDAPVLRACFGADGERVLTIAGDRAARIWDARSGLQIESALVHPADVREAVFDATGGRVLTVCADGKARIWRLGSGSGPSVLERAGAAITCAAFDARGELAATGGTDDAIVVWDVAACLPVRELAFDRKGFAPGGIHALAFNPARDEIAAACGDLKVRAWNPRTGASTRPDVVVFAARSLAFSCDGERLLVTGRWGGGAAKVLGPDSTRAPIQAEMMHTADLTAGRFSADGRYVLTVSEDGTAHVWDSASGRPVSYRTLRPVAILDASFDGGVENPRVIAALADGGVSIWPVDPLPAARARKPREIRAAEKTREQRLALPLVYE